LKRKFGTKKRDTTAERKRFFLEKEAKTFGAVPDPGLVTGCLTCLPTELRPLIFLFQAVSWFG
jgi:hypothetical protein